MNYTNRHRKAADVIRQLLSSGPKRWKELKAECEKRGIPKSTLAFNLRKMIKAGEIMKRALPEGYVYELGHLELKPANVEEVEMLIDILNKSSSKEAVECAEDDLLELCSKYSMAHVPKLWLFLHQSLKSGRELLALRILLAIANYAKKTKDAEAVKILRSFKDEVCNMIQHEELGLLATEFLSLILDVRERMELFTGKVEECLKSAGDREYECLINKWIYLLRRLYEEKPLDIKKWLYKLMEDPSESVRKRAEALYRKLKYPHII